MKKKVSWICVIGLIFLLSACVNKEEKQDVLDFSFANYFGYSLSDYCKETNNLLEIFEEVLEGTGFYTSTNFATFDEVEYTPFLLLDNKGDFIYGGGYQAIISSSDETVWSHVEKVKQFLMTEYGEPSTYEGLDNLLSKMTSFSDIKAYGNALERWTIEREDTLEVSSYEDSVLTEEMELLVSYSGENVVIKVTQRIYILPQ